MKKPRLSRGLTALVGIVVASCQPAADRSLYATEVEATQAQHGARVALAHHLTRVWDDLDAGRGRAAGERLAALWPLGELLYDDGELRAAVRRLASLAVPATLAAPRALELARSALDKGDLDAARRHLTPIAEAGPSTTSTRAEIMLALTELTTGGRSLAQSRLARVANSRAASSLARDLGAFARLTLASSYLDEDAYQPAIEHFLRVESTSGYWREARVGLATAQRRAGRPERALKILALLRGGLIGDPQRAALAAMSAHSVGLADEAVAIIDGALARLDAFDPATVSASDVLELVATDGARASAAREDETLLTIVAGTAALRRLALELIATRDHRGLSRDVADALAAYAARVRARFDATLRRELAFHTERLQLAVQDLHTLRPQIAGPGARP